MAYKQIISVPVWRMEAPLLAVTGFGVSIAGDMRNNNYACPYSYLLRANAALDVFDPVTSGWLPLASPGLAGTFGVGATLVFHPSQGPRGTIAAGATATTLTLTTALPAAVGVNQLSSNGNGIGFVLRVVDNVAGGSGKTEERRVIANTAGTTPTITLDSPLSFSPGTGATYEFLSGRVYLLGAGTLAAGSFKYYDTLTNSYSGNLSIVNLPASLAVESQMVALSEQHVSNDRQPGEGFVSGGATSNGTLFNAIAATAASGTTITGSGMPATLFANEYSNFQVRIVEDTVNKTAVGQRRRITSHTSGATGVFTVPTWTVTPSSSAKFVIENDDDKIIMRGGTSSTTTYTYNLTANTWDTTTFTAGAVAHQNGGVLVQSFGITRDPTGNARHSHLFVFSGGSNALYVLDIATNTFGASLDYGNKGNALTTYSCAAYDPVTLGGKYVHINLGGTQNFVRFNLQSRIMDASTPLKYTQGAAVPGNKMVAGFCMDGATKVGVIYAATNSQVNFFSLLVQG